MSTRLNEQDPPERDLPPAGSIPVHDRVRQGRSLSGVLAATLAVFSAVACDDQGADVPPMDQVAVVVPVVAASAETPPLASEPADASDLAYDPLVPTAIAIDIDTELATLCGVDEGKVFFTFDSTRLLPAAKVRLEQIATCSKTGPIQGQALLVVGRTDPVGTDEYNELLGMSRADAVARYLGEVGVDKALIVTESRGEAAAEEKFPGSWPYNRRVTVRLLPPPATPGR